MQNMYFHKELRVSFFHYSIYKIFFNKYSVQMRRNSSRYQMQLRIHRTANRNGRVYQEKRPTRRKEHQAINFFARFIFVSHSQTHINFFFLSFEDRMITRGCCRRSETRYYNTLHFYSWKCEHSWDIINIFQDIIVDPALYISNGVRYKYFL